MRGLLLFSLLLAGCSFSPATPCSPAAPCRDGVCRGGFCVFEPPVEDAGQDAGVDAGQDAGPPPCAATCPLTEGYWCANEVCTWGLTPIEFQAPDAGALISQVVQVKLVLRVLASQAVLPPSVQLEVLPEDAGLGPYTVPFNPPGGNFVQTVVLPSPGRFTFIGSAGGTTATTFVDNDPLPPVLALEVVPGPPRGADGGWTDDDPACPGCYKRDERARLRLRTDEVLDARTMALTVLGLRRDGGAFPPSGLGVWDAGFFPGPDGGNACLCPGALCRCFEVDLGQHPFEAGRGRLTVQGSARDSAGNVGTTTAQVEVTRLRWQRRLPLAPGEALYPPAASPAFGALLLATDGVGSDAGSTLLRLDQGGGIVGQANTPWRVVAPPVVTDTGTRRLLVLQSDGGSTTLDGYQVANLALPPTRWCSPPPGLPLGNLTTGVTPDGGAGFAADVAVFALATPDGGRLFRAQGGAACVPSPLPFDPGGGAALAMGPLASALYLGTGLGAGGGLQGAFLLDAGVQPFPQAQPIADCAPTSLAVDPQGAGQVVVVCTGAGGSRLMQLSADLTGAPWLGPPALNTAEKIGPLSLFADAGVTWGLFTAGSYPPLTSAQGPALFQQALGAVNSPALSAPFDGPHAPTIGRDGTRYLVTGGGELVALDAALGTVWRFQGVPSQPSAVLLDCKRGATGAAVAGRPGSAFVLGREADSGVVSAFSVDSRGLDVTSPWPMEAGTSRNNWAPMDSASATAFTCP